MNIRAISDVVSDLGEGPIWSPQTQCVTWTDITQNIFHTADFNTGATRSFPSPSMVGAIAHTREGDYVAATQEGFARVDIDGKFSPLQTYSKVIDNVTLSNGMGWSPDAKYFYYIDSIPGVLKRFDYESVDGCLSNPIDLITFETSLGIPDGMSVTTDGKIVVALWDGRRLEVYEPSGKKISEIKLGVSRPTSCTFGGEDGNVLIVTTASQGIDLATEPLAGKILAVTGTGLSGLPPHRYG
ncbi:MAG: hypothetical protein EBY78_05275 [Actinobacteria bacterium]|nr:hypothetical protein [Actinomycetota bacterium]